jgi:hypothetical protein
MPPYSPFAHMHKYNTYKLISCILTFECLWLFQMAVRLIRRVSVFVCVCILAGRMFVCAYVCVDGFVCVCMLAARMFVSMYVWMYVSCTTHTQRKCLCMCLYIGGKNVCMCLCMCEWICMCLYVVSKDVCIYVCVNVCQLHDSYAA